MTKVYVIYCGCEGSEKRVHEHHPTMFSIEKGSSQCGKCNQYVKARDLTEAEKLSLVPENVLKKFINETYDTVYTMVKMTKITEGEKYDKFYDILMDKIEKLKEIE